MFFWDIDVKSYNGLDDYMLDRGFCGLLLRVEELLRQIK